MAKLVTSPVANFNIAGLATLEANMTAIEVAMEKTLSRDGTTPNQMEADLDLNDNDILNVGTISAEHVILLNDGEIINEDTQRAEAARIAAEAARDAAIVAQEGSEEAEDDAIAAAQDSAAQASAALASAQAAAASAVDALNEADRAEDEADRAELEADRAETAASAAIAAGNLYADTTAFIDNSVDGEYGFVLGAADGDVFATLYLNDTEVAVDQGLAVPSFEAYAKVHALIQALDPEDDDAAISLVDTYGSLYAQIALNGDLLVGKGAVSSDNSKMFVVTNAAGAIGISIDEELQTIGSLNITNIDLPGVFIVGPNDQIYAQLDQPIDDGDDGGSTEAVEVPSRNLYLVGDSRNALVTSASNPTVRTSGRTRAQGWLPYVEIQTGANFEFQPSFNYGVGSSTSEDMLASIGQVTVLDPGYVVICSDTNDRTAGWTAARTITALKSVQAQLLAAGHYIIWFASSPRGDNNGGTWSAGLSGTDLANHLQVHDWMMRQGRKSRQFVFDPWPALVSPTSSSAFAKDTALRDGLHWGATGARLIGDAAVDLFNDLFPSSPRLISTNGDAYSTNNPNGALNANPMLDGTGGTFGAGCSGSLATSWEAVAGTGLDGDFTKVTDADGNVWQRIVVSGAAEEEFSGDLPIDPMGFSVVATSQIDPADINPGDLIEATCEVVLAAGSSGVRGLSLYLTIEDDDGVKTFACGECDTARSPPNLDYSDKELSGILKTPKTVGLTGTIVDAYLSFVVTGAPHVDATPDAAISADVMFRACSARKTAII